MEPRRVSAIARGSAMVLEMGILVVGGAFVGSWLDDSLSTSPLFLLLLSIGMLVVGIYRIHRVIERIENPDGTDGDNS